MHVNVTHTNMERVLSSWVNIGKEKDGDVEWRKSIERYFAREDWGGRRKVEGREPLGPTFTIPST